MQHSMTMAKSTTLRILTCQANWCTVCKNGCKRESFGLPPINTAFRTERISATLQRTSKFRIGRETLGPIQQLLIECYQLLSSNRCKDSVSLTIFLAIL